MVYTKNFWMFQRKKKTSHLNEVEIRKFHAKVGKDVEQVAAEIIHDHLRKPIDYVPDTRDRCF